jgi:adenosylcobinamide-GDP ribazoletransferase
VRSLLTGVAFLTRLPVGRLAAFEEADVARSAGWFPLIGALLGILYSLVAWLLKDHLPLVVIGALLVILDALVTGALHFDGLADTADGFGGGKSREDVLRIMRDHAIGSYGGTALALLVVLKVAAYAALLDRPYWFRALVVVPVLGRWSMLLLIGALPYARQTASVIQSMGRGALVLGTLTTVAIVFAIGLRLAWVPFVAVAAVTVLFGLYCRNRIAGITGDTLGANLQLCESAALVAFLWVGRP